MLTPPGGQMSGTVLLFMKGTTYEGPWIYGVTYMKHSRLASQKISNNKALRLGKMRTLRYMKSVCSVLSLWLTTGHTIAYTTMQVSVRSSTSHRIINGLMQGYFQLSMMPIWGIIDQTSLDSLHPFDLQDFYIITLFEGDDVDEVWVWDTLTWWDLCASPPLLSLYMLTL